MIDVAPTVMDVLQIETPEEIDGIPQIPVHGKSFADLFSNPDAKTRSTQFYLMRGSRAIYHKGWKAIAFHERGTPFEEDRWELYDTEKDFCESNDLAEEQPEKLEQLKELWWSEAERYGALPLVEFQPPWLNED
jgi:arylsulfatase